MAIGDFIQSVNYPAPQFAMTPRSLVSITDLIVHHTAGPLAQTPLEIDQEHRNIGDAMIAYNYVITPDGTAYNGRPDDVVPAAAYGRNAQSVNVVLVGNFEPESDGFTGKPTDQQLDRLLALSIYLHRRYPHIERTIGHRDVAPLFYPNDQGLYATACPGSLLYAQLADIRRKTAVAVNPFH